MKIGFLVNNLNAGAGGGRYASEMINAIQKAGNQVVVLTDIGCNGPNPILKRGIGMLTSAFMARSLLKDCDIIHALDGYPYGIIGAIIAIKLKKKFIITAQGTYSVAPLYNFSTSIIMRWAYKKADEIIAISNYTRAEILKKISLSNIKVISHGIDLAKFYQEHQVSGKNFILGVGAAKQRKGYHISIPAFAKISKNLPDYKYYIVADDGREHLEKIVEREGLKDKVVFFEGISDEKLLELYRTARLFILTSVSTPSHHIEGFGLVYLEAAATGTPVIGTLGTGAVDAVSDGQNGILVPQDDIDATKDAISKILSDDTMWRKMSVAGHEWAKKNSIDNEIVKYINIYKNYENTFFIR